MAAFDGAFVGASAADTGAGTTSSEVCRAAGRRERTGAFVTSTTLADVSAATTGSIAPFELARGARRFTGATVASATSCFVARLARDVVERVVLVVTAADSEAREVTCSLSQDAGGDTRARTVRQMSRAPSSPILARSSKRPNIGIDTVGAHDRWVSSLGVLLLRWARSRVRVQLWSHSYPGKARFSNIFSICRMKSSFEALRLLKYLMEG